MHDQDAEGPLENAERYRSILTTWIISTEHLVEDGQKGLDAVNLLRLWAYLGNNGLSYKFFRPDADCTCNLTKHDGLAGVLTFAIKRKVHDYHQSNAGRPCWAYLKPTDTSKLGFRVIDQAHRDLIDSIERIASDQHVFRETISQLRRYSLAFADSDPEQTLYSLHPVTHEWSFSLERSAEERHRYLDLTTRITRSAMSHIDETHPFLERQRLFSHVNMLARRGNVEKEVNVNLAIPLLEIARLSHDSGQSVDLEMCKRVADVFESRSGSNAIGFLVAANLLGTLHWEQGDHREAVRILEHALDGAKDEEKIPKFQAMYRLGNIYIDQGETSKAEYMLFRALTGFQARNLHRQALDTASSLFEMYNDRGQRIEAYEQQCLVWSSYAALVSKFKKDPLSPFNEQLYEAQKIELVNAILQVVLQPDQTAQSTARESNAETVGSFAIVFRLWHQYGVAESLLTRALKLYRDTFGPHHTRTLQTMRDLGDVLGILRKPADAKEILSQAWEKCREQPRQQYKVAVEIALRLAFLYSEEGDWPTARHILKTALHLAENNPDMQPLLLSHLLRDLGVLDHRLGDLEMAKVRLNRALETYRRAFGPGSPRTIHTTLDLSSVLMQQQDWQSAEKILQQALEHATSSQSFGHQHQTTLSIARQLCGAYQAQAFRARKLDIRTRLRLHSQFHSYGQPSCSERLSKIITLHNDFLRSAHQHYPFGRMFIWAGDDSNAVIGCAIQDRSNLSCDNCDAKILTICYVCRVCEEIDLCDQCYSLYETSDLDNPGMRHCKDHQFLYTERMWELTPGDNNAWWENISKRYL